MKQTVLPIFILALIAHACSAAIVMPTSESEHLTRLHKAAIDIFMTCYGDPGNTVGVIGDSDGSILKALWSNYSIPAILVDTTMTMRNSVTSTNQHKLQVFVVAVESPDRFHELMMQLLFSIWWNHYANFLIVSSTPNVVRQCSNIVQYLYIAFENFGVLRAQFICIDRKMNVNIFNFNPYTPKAPEPWQLVRSYKTKLTPFSVFKRTYREGGNNCDALNFEKTNDLGGSPFHIMIPPGAVRDKITGSIDAWIKTLESPTVKNLVELFFQQNTWFIDNIVMGLNASIIISENTEATGIIGVSDVVSNMPLVLHDRIIYTWEQSSLLAMTQHTGHMSQLEKILKAIYTGDLASLLTRVVAYPHVDTMQDIVDLGYTIYTLELTKNLLAADPILDGHVINVPEGRGCVEDLLGDPLATCIVDYKTAVILAYHRRLHLSRDIIKNDYTFYGVSPCNPLGRKLNARIRTWDECSLRPTNRIFAMIHSGLVNDDEVNKNVVRRVMTMDDLMFAFVILAIGLTCSFVCFIGEIVIRSISLRIAKRRNRVRPPSAWGDKENDKNKCLSFSALKLRFYQLRLFSNRR